MCAWLVCRVGVRVRAVTLGGLGSGGGRGWEVGLDRAWARGRAGRCVMRCVYFSVGGGEGGVW